MGNEERLLALPEKLAEKHGVGEACKRDNFFSSPFHILELRQEGQVIGFIGHAEGQH